MMLHRNSTKLFTTILCAGLAGTCLTGQGVLGKEAGTTKPKPATISRAVAVFCPTQGNNVRGLVTFTQVEGGIRVVADLEGLTPGTHGFHIHEYGDCSSADGMSAGGHFNPKGVQHCGPDCAMRHVGDLGNLKADADGKAHVDRVDTQLKFKGVASIIGRSVIVHAKADDLTSQPSGNAGARVACGVVGIAENK